MNCIFCYSGIRFWLLHQLNKKIKKYKSAIPKQVRHRLPRFA